MSQPPHNSSSEEPDRPLGDFRPDRSVESGTGRRDTDNAVPSSLPPGTRRDPASRYTDEPRRRRSASGSGNPAESANVAAAGGASPSATQGSARIPIRRTRERRDFPERLIGQRRTRTGTATDRGSTVDTSPAAIAAGLTSIDPLHIDDESPFVAPPPPTPPRPQLQQTTIQNWTGTEFQLQRQPAAPQTHFLNNSGRNVQGRTWVFTLWDEQIIPPQPAGRELPVGVDFMSFQRELGSNSDEQHWQGYIEFNERLTVRQIKELMGWDRVWLAPRYGSQKDAIEYTKKEQTAIPGTHREVGTKHTENAPQSWASAVTSIQGGATYREMCETHTRLAAQCSSGIQKVIQVMEPIPRWRDVQVNVYWGPTGTGKTSRVYDQEQDPNEIYSKIDGNWWCGYEGQSAILFDEFTSEIPIRDMLKFLDGHGLRVNVRNATRVARWTRVYICSNINPAEWYPRAPQCQRDALFRRIKSENIFFMDKPAIRNSDSCASTTVAELNTPLSITSPTLDLLKVPVDRSQTLEF